MKPVSHKFFLTSPTQPMPLVFTDGVVIDATTGSLFSSANNSATGKVALNGEKYLYFNVDYPYSGTATQDAKPFIQFYNSANAVISTVYIKGQVIEVPANAKKYAVNMRNDYPAFTFRDNNFFLLSLIEAQPHYKKLTKKISRESQQRFYRDTLTGDITFFGPDYDYIKGMDLFSEGLFFVVRADNTVWYSQKFTKVDFEIDHFRKSAKLKLKVADPYEQVTSKQGRQFNITKIGASHEWVYLRKKPLIQAYVMGGSTVSNFFSGVYEEAEVTEIQDDYKTLVTDNHFAYCATAQEFEITGAPENDANGVYSGTGGIYVNANGWEIQLLEVVTVAGQWSLYVYRPGGSLFAVSTFVERYKPSDFSDLDIRGTYPQCIYIVYPSYAEGIRFSPSRGGAVIEGMALKNLITSHVFMRVLCDSPTITKPNDSQIKTYDLPLEDFAYSGRNYNKCVGWESSDIYTTAITSSEPTEYGINDYNKYFTDVFPTGARKVVPLCPTSWGNASIWWDYPTNFSALATKGVNSWPVLIKHTYSLQTVIASLLRKAGIPLLHNKSDSKFLYGETDPTLRSNDKWKNILIAPITNILKSDYTQAAQRGDISLEMVFDMLRKVFNCYWYIENGHLKIEHISFFMNNLSYTAGIQSGISLDLTTLRDQFNKMHYTYDQQKVSYDTKELPSQFVFKYGDESSEVFTNVKLVMENAPYVDASLDSEVTIDNFSADIDMMLLNPDNFNNDSFALLCPEYVDITEDGRTYSMQLYERTLTDSEGRSYKVMPQNLYASWLHLLKYHIDDIPAVQVSNSLNIPINVIPTQQAFMSQTIRVPEALNIQPYQLIKTSVGTGQVESMEIELDTAIAEITLRHNPK